MVDSSLIDAVDEHERTAIYYACQGRNTKVIETLLLQDAITKSYYKLSVLHLLKLQLHF